jgi:KDO2-lipid IV(A) lauroyltransferase
MKTLFKNIFYIFAFLIFKSPPWFKEFLAAGIGILWFDILRIRRAVALSNIPNAFPEVSLKKATQIARASVIQMGRTIVDFNTLVWISPTQLRKSVEFEGLDYIDKALQQNKGVIVLGCHIANGDFGVLALSNFGYPMHLISKRFSNLWLDDIWFSVRGRFGTQFIAPRNSSYEILKALKKNACVIFVLDQFMGPPLGARTVFFGRETGTAMGLALFAQKTGAPVVPCYSKRREDGRYVVCFEPEVPFEDVGDKNKNVQYMTQKYTDRVEAIVRRYPEQWLWIHRRWKVFRE